MCYGSVILELEHFGWCLVSFIGKMRGVGGLQYP